MKKIIFFTVLLFVGISLKAQIYLQENFDASIPSTWQITDAGEATGDSWYSGTIGGNGLNGTNAAVVNSDSFGNGIYLLETLTSPIFDSSAATNLVLSFQQYFRRYADEEAFVEVFDGTQWVTVLSISSNTGGFSNPDNQSINITAYKNATMQIRFHYDDNDSWGWYWLIDNVSVYNETCPSPTNVAINSITADTASISWNNTSSEVLSSEIVVQLSGTGMPTGSGTPVSGTTYLAENLQAATYYEVYIRSICSTANGNSVWVGPFNFTTLNTPPPPSPVTFSTISVPDSGTNRAVVDMNADFLDDLVSISTTNVNIIFQDPTATNGFTTVNIPTPDADYSPSWSLAAGDLDANGYNDLLYGAGSGVTIMTAVVDAGNLDNGIPFDDVTTFSEYSTSSYVFSQRSNFADINNDGNLDAFVCHDVEPNVYFINDGNGTLNFYQTLNTGAPYNLGDYSSGGNYGSIWIDYDNDHDLDMFIAKCGGETARRTNQMHTNDGLNTNNETISYTENAADIGLADPMQTWSSAWGDFDNDGDMDVFVGASSGTHKLMRNDFNTSGTFTDVTATSGVAVLTATGIENVTYDFDNDGNLDIFSNGNILFGHGDLTFDVYTMMNVPNSGAFGDVNNDGFIDAFNNGSVYRNNTNNNNWITINTIGGAIPGYSNRNGIGARVEVHTPFGVRIRDVRSGEGFRYMSTLNTHVGLGTDTTINQVVIYWPSGIIDTINNPAINQTLTVVEGSTLSVIDNELTDMLIYPNPVKQVLNIQTKANLTNRIASVFDIHGKRVINTKLKQNFLDVSFLAKGVYILRLESNGKVFSSKFIKE